MKTAGAGLISLLNTSDQVFIADLYTFTLNDGSLLKYTNADQDISTFISSDLVIDRDGIRIVRGVEVDTLKLRIAYQPTSTFAKTLHSGGLDGARILIQRAIMPTFGDISNGLVTMFSGRVADCDFDRTQANINAKSDFELLNIQMPRNLYQPSCSHSLYGTGCGVVKASFTTNGAINSTSTTQTFNTNITAVSGIFDQGVILFTSGLNAGVKRTVKSQINGVINITLPLAYASLMNDTFSISQGCDKTKVTCSAKFNNLTRFRGFPYVPQPETAR